MTLKQIGWFFGTLLTLSACQFSKVPKPVFLDDLLAHADEYSSEKIRTRGLIVGNVADTGTLVISPLETASNISVLVNYQNLPQETRTMLSGIVITKNDFYTSAGNIRPEMMLFVEIVGTLDKHNNVLMADRVDILNRVRR